MTPPGTGDHAKPLTATDEGTLEERLAALEAECRAIREEVADLARRVEPAIESAALVARVINHRINDQRQAFERREAPGPAQDVPEEPPEEVPTRWRFLCRWLGHSPGPQMGLMVTCNRCSAIYRLSRGR